MKPLKRINYYGNGNDESRIGPNTRNAKIPSYKEIELMLDEVAPLSITCDVTAVQPPFFSEFCYHDTLGGIFLTTLSSEVTARVYQKALDLEPVEPFPLGRVMDKYDLAAPPKRYKKVIMLAGSNALHLIDQSAVQRLMMEDEEWMIKIHPVTNEGMIRDLASIYGYHRLIDPKVSGMAVLDQADEIATMMTSETYIVARYLGKPVRDVTRFDRSWLTSYSTVIRNLKGDDQDKDRIDRMLMSPISGYMRPEWDMARNVEQARGFFETAMEIRENFRMITNQRLQVADKTFVEWK